MSLLSRLKSLFSVKDTSIVLPTDISLLESEGFTPDNFEFGIEIYRCAERAETLCYFEFCIEIYTFRRSAIFEFGIEHYTLWRADHIETLCYF